jgi:hypothetical protein
MISEVENFCKFYNMSLKKVISIFIILTFLLSFFHTKAQAPEIVWQKFYGGTSREIFTDAAESIDGGFIINSTTFSIDGDCSSRTDPNSLDSWVFEIGGFK